MENRFLVKVRALMKVGGVLMIAMGTLLPMDAKAFPFDQTPEGFMEYLNNASWNGSSNYRFFNAYKCLKIDALYMCYLDYEETSPLGIRTCVNVPGSHAYGKNMINPQGTRTFSAGECSDWEKVSATPEPQPTPPNTEDINKTPEVPSQPQPSTSPADDAGLTKTQVIAGGVSLLCLGVIIGGGVGLISKKKFKQ